MNLGPTIGGLKKSPLTVRRAKEYPVPATENATMAFPFRCSYCEHDTTIGVHDASSHLVVPGPTGKDTGPIGFRVTVIICPNPECRKTCARVLMKKVHVTADGYTDASEPSLQEWDLLPRSQARQYPDYVPQAIREDYEEAHLIVNDSAKASATLARRALQGLLRDFYAATGRTLKVEIESVAAKIDPTLLEAIHTVRDVGNIGAHMEADIDHIVPVDPGEAETLLQLLELLLDETYVARHGRDQKVGRVLKLGADKKALKASPDPMVPYEKP